MCGPAQRWSVNSMCFVSCSCRDPTWHGSWVVPVVQMLSKTIPHVIDFLWHYCTLCQALLQIAQVRGGFKQIAARFRRCITIMTFQELPLSQQSNWYVQASQNQVSGCHISYEWFDMTLFNVFLKEYGIGIASFHSAKRVLHDTTTATLRYQKILLWWTITQGLKDVPLCRRKSA